MTPGEAIAEKCAEAVSALYGSAIDPDKVPVQQTRKDFDGDITVTAFAFTPHSKKSPGDTARELGEYLTANMKEVTSFNVIKGFLNLTVSDDHWTDVLNGIDPESAWWRGTGTPRHIMVEFSSPNTNKPLHLGHVRNNLLGFSVSEILKACGNRVVRVNLVNDRGIHICKSMLAWQRWGNGETPVSSGIKGDKLVGKYYVRFEQEMKKQTEDGRQEAGGRGQEAGGGRREAGGRLARRSLGEGGRQEKEQFSDEERAASPLMKEAQEMLRKWEEDDPEIRQLWTTMNGWVYEGFDATYRALGIVFERTDYESETYLSGREQVLKALEEGILYKKDDGSVWIDLRDEGLDEKLLLRSDGTSVYITQDIGTAIRRFEEFRLDRHIYVVGNEQDYHFAVLKHILKKMGFAWADNLHHMSYGMVDLPGGKMKSREGTVVDADDLIAEVVAAAKAKTEELGKVEALSPEAAERLYRIIGLGALKYHILKVDPKKRMLFNPEESIDFNGHTGPFIQYTHARICSVLRKAREAQVTYSASLSAGLVLLPPEKELVKGVLRFPSVAREAGTLCSPALVANYTYELAKAYNQFYHDVPILKEADKEKVLLRLRLSDAVRAVIRDAMALLGIEVPERM